MISFFLLFLLQMVYFSSNFVTIETKGKVHRIRLSLKRQIFNQLEQINYLLLMSMNSYFNNPLGNKSRSTSFFIFSERRPVCQALAFKFIETLILYAFKKQIPDNFFFSLRKGSFCFVLVVKTAANLVKFYQASPPSKTYRKEPFFKLAMWQY